MHHAVLSVVRDLLLGPHREPRSRGIGRLALIAVVVAAAACHSPNSVFHSRTDFNRDVGHLFALLIGFGTVVFVVVESLLILTIVRFRRRGAARQPLQVHGNTKLEIAWTLVPALILLIIALPTVRTTFRTQALARPDALQIQAIGHQWWWEFRYPQYTRTNAAGQVDTVVTANELYLPLGRTVNFALTSQDVAHSFWIPSLGGKRDLIPTHTNYLWFTPDSTTATAFNGFCAEFCGVSHANMRFRAFTVTPRQFVAWTEHQLSPAVFAIPAVTSLPLSSVAFAGDSLPAYTIPAMRLPADVRFDASIRGDPARGGDLLMKGQGACLGCHVIRGNPSMVGTMGPNLTHIGSRTTIASGMFPNDEQHLTLWLKNARKLKPGSLMPALGMNEYDPVLGKRVTAGGLTDQQIADVVAYLQALK
jgi:cytochrome c oxidase subunit 2